MFNITYSQVLYVNKSSHGVQHKYSLVFYKKYRGILYVEHCGKIYLHKILRNIVCWALWEDYLHIIKIFLPMPLNQIKLNLVDMVLTRHTPLSMTTISKCTKYWGILHVEHCGKIYLHKLLGNTWKQVMEIIKKPPFFSILLWNLGKCQLTNQWDKGKIYLRFHLTFLIKIG
jgi:hypothetical protein